MSRNVYFLKHPISSDKIRAYLVNFSIFKLIFIFIVVNILIGVIFGFLYHIFDANGKTIFQWIEFSILLLFNASSDINISQAIPHRIFYLSEAFLAITLPAMFLGAIIFKLLINPKIFVFRQKCAVYFDERRGKHVLCVRFYSSSPLSLADLKITTTFCNLRRDPQGTRMKIELYRTIKKNDLYQLDAHIPYSIKISLQPSDVNSQDKQLNSLKGKDISLDGANITILIVGRIPRLGTEFAETYDYYFPEDLQWGKPQNIAVFGDFPKSTPSEQWSGWSNFEGTETE